MSKNIYIFESDMIYMLILYTTTYSNIFKWFCTNNYCEYNINIIHLPILNYYIYILLINSC